MYMSPEVIKGENPGRAGAVDVWSLGCVILEMATGRRPCANLDNEWELTEADLAEAVAALERDPSLLTISGSEKK
jgi:serine/threonine protein kinase